MPKPKRLYTVDLTRQPFRQHSSAFVTDTELERFTTETELHPDLSHAWLQTVHKEPPFKRSQKIRIQLSRGISFDGGTDV